MDVVIDVVGIILIVCDVFISIVLGVLIVFVGMGLL